MKKLPIILVLTGFITCSALADPATATQQPQTATTQSPKTVVQQPPAQTPKNVAAQPTAQTPKNVVAQPAPAPAAPSNAAKQPATTAATTAPKGVIHGRVIDAQTKQPIEKAVVTLDDEAVCTDKNGVFNFSKSGQTLKLRAAGYNRVQYPLAQIKDFNNLALQRFNVKGLYLTVYGTASSKIREAAIQTLKKNNMNALVIDFKGDKGFIPFKVDIPMAQQSGAQDTILVKDMPEMIDRLKKQGIYLIARIVVFKDDRLANAHPEWAVKKNGSVFKDREHLRWVDPFRKEVWDYNIQIAQAAAKMGFDEVQFDYVRCPDTKGIVFSQPSNIDTRTATISGFLSSAHKALIPSNVFVSADIFGYVLWNLDDTGIGQQIDKALDSVDIVCPMLYPSGFHLGIPSYRNPVQHSYEIVYLTLKKGQERTGCSSLHFRPWLQAFRDYAFRGGDFKESRMALQIKAAKNFGASGYMFWNPRNVYADGKFDQ